MLTDDTSHRRRARRWSVALALLGTVMIAAGCTIKQIPPTTPPLSVAAGGKGIVRLPTVLLYESVSTGEILDAPPEDAAQRSPVIDAGIQARLAARHIETVAAVESAPEMSVALDEVRPHYRLLVGPRRDRTSATPALNNLQSASGKSWGLLPLVIIRVGSKGGYDGNSGAIWTTTSSTSVRIALVSLQDGQRIWFREAFMRSMANENDMNRALDIAFRE